MRLKSKLSAAKSLASPMKMPSEARHIDGMAGHLGGLNVIFRCNNGKENDLQSNFKCGENRNHGKFKIYFLMVEL